MAGTLTLRFLKSNNESTRDKSSLFLKDNHWSGLSCLMTKLHVLMYSQNDFLVFKRLDHFFFYAVYGTLLLFLVHHLVTHGLRLCPKSKFWDLQYLSALSNLKGVYEAEHLCSCHWPFLFVLNPEEKNRMISVVL